MAPEPGMRELSTQERFSHAGQPRCVHHHGEGISRDGRQANTTHKSDQATKYLLVLKNGMATSEGIFENREEEDPYEPCALCGWTAQRHHRESRHYKSSIKALWSADDRGTWALGEKYILKERRDEQPNNEVVGTRFLKSINAAIPVPDIAMSWTDRNKVFIMQERVDGRPLAEVYSRLTEEERDRIASQVAHCLGEMRKMTSDRMQSVDGGPIAPYKRYAIDPTSSDDEFFNALVHYTQGYANLPDEVHQVLREHMPSCAPFTFTHADLEQVNILVKDGNLAAIIDWEFAAYFPVWWEFAKFALGFKGQDIDFRRKVDKYLPQEDKHEKAKLWRMAYIASRDGRRLEDVDRHKLALKNLVDYGK